MSGAGRAVSGAGVEAGVRQAGVGVPGGSARGPSAVSAAREAVSGLTFVGTLLSNVGGMFSDASVVGCSWDVLARRLDVGRVIARWAASVGLAGVRCVADLLAAWDDPARTHGVGDALVRLAAVDGGNDGDALLVVLHLASPVVWRLVGRLRDLDSDIVAIVVGELCCQIRGYRWRARSGGLLANLEFDTRAGVLAELRPAVRRHPERTVRLTVDGDIARVYCGPAAAGVEFVDLLTAALARGVPRADIELLVACQDTRGRRGDTALAAAHGMSVRTLYRRRAATLDELRAAAADLLAATA